MKNLFKLTFALSIASIFVLDLLSSYYLVVNGSGGWVAIAWILGGVPSLLLPLFTPYVATYLFVVFIFVASAAYLNNASDLI